MEAWTAIGGTPEHLEILIYIRLHMFFFECSIKFRDNTWWLVDLCKQINLQRELKRGSTNFKFLIHNPDADNKQEKNSTRQAP